jgi:uncharacterized protein (TIGR03118 family)
VGRFLYGRSEFWISDQGAGGSSLFSVTGSTGVPATNFAAIPPGAGMIVGPTGQVSNPAAATNPAGASFDIGSTGPAFFIFANLNGTISAWNPMNANRPAHNAATVVATAPGAIYTGLAMNSAGNLLYAANGTTGAIDEFNGSFTNVTALGSFVDPTLPAGFAPST